MENRLPLRISLPFVAGVACGAVLPLSGSPSWPTAIGHLGAAALLLSAVCMALLVFSRRRGDRVLLAVMLFATGLFCYSARAADLYRPFEGPRLSFLADRLRQLIDGAGFGDPRSAPLLKALMTGERSGLDRDTVIAFRRSGASHLLALSGLHMGIIATLIRYLLAVLGKSRPAELIRSALLVGFCFVYTVACGASPSLVRALLFIILGQASALSPGRRSSPADRLCIAATVQLALDPLSIGSVAFQLSYLAMIGVVFLAPRLEAWYPATRTSARFDPLRRIWQAASLAIACQLTTAPVVLLRFGYLPQYFLLTNLLAMPVCELLLPLAILTLMLGSPALLVRATDSLAGLLLAILEIISGL